MKSIQTLIIMILLGFSFTGIGQTTTVPLSDLASGDILDDTYYKDIDGNFDKYVGTWSWTEGTSEFTIELSVREQFYYEPLNIYLDQLIGKYTYIDNGLPIAIAANQTIEEIPILASTEFDTGINLLFIDFALEKRGKAKLEILNPSVTSLRWTLQNNSGVKVSFEGDTPFNYNFSVPTSKILQKN